MPAAKERDIFDALLNLSAQVDQQAREPNILAYKPHVKQEFFHKAEDPLRLYIGGNRSGKTFGTVAEDIWWCTGTHPYLKTPKPPIRGRVVGVDLLQGVIQILLPLFKRLTPPSELKGGSWEKAFNTYSRILTFANGSTIEFMSYEMADEKFAGTSRHFIHYDEEPPKGIFDECQARLIDTEGSSWISMTPVKGMTWVFDNIYEPTREAPDLIMLRPEEAGVGAVYRSPQQEVTIIEVDTDENPYLTEKGKQRYFARLSDEDVQARQRGSFVQRSGLVFKNFSRDKHVVLPVTNPASRFKDCLIYSSVDHGWNNPTAWLWHAVFPNGDVVTFGEHYAREMTIAEHAGIVLAKEAEWGITPDHRTGDPAMKQTSGITGTSVYQEYANLGIYLELDSVPRETEIGLAKMQQYFKIKENGEPSWYITEDCKNFIRELKALHFKKYVNSKAQHDNNVHEEVQKKDDHTYDSARYFATFLPDLAPDSPIKQQGAPARIPGQDYDENLWALYNRDKRQEGAEESLWEVVEEY